MLPTLQWNSSRRVEYTTNKLGQNLRYFVMSLGWSDPALLWLVRVFFRKGILSEDF